MIKIAFLFLTLDNVHYPEFWEKYFKNNYDKINIYCHPKYPEKVNVKWQKDNIIFKLVDTSWGYIVDAYISLLLQAIKNKDNIKFITISESCIPIISFNKFYNFVTKNVKTSYIKYMKIKNYDLNERIKKQKGYEKIKFIKHYARFCLSRHHVKKLLSNKNNISFFKKMHVGDEFFLSSLKNSNNIIDYLITYDNWEYTNNEVNKINKKIKLKYEDIESNKLNDLQIIKTKKEIEKLKNLKNDISKNPKTYDIIDVSDIDQVKESGAFFWRKIAKNSNILLFKNEFDFFN